ncbi:hypothetical protein [Micromonospora nigra]|uniref:hypothetical protein n=1 Tax=Micromonospora nigra TaxID=145857 RepID=UPI001FE0464A|nr:hypothetical protein [Micromonospora nigra]
MPQIAQRWGLSRSTAYLWVREVSLVRDGEQERERRRAHSEVMTDGHLEDRWDHEGNGTWRGRWGALECRGSASSFCPL